MTDLWIAFTATWHVWAWIAFFAGVAWLLLAAEHRADRVQRNRDAETAATLEHIARCNARNGTLWCDRAKGHTGIHTDSRHGRELGWARWPA